LVVLAMRQVERKIRVPGFIGSPNSAAAGH